MKATPQQHTQLKTLLAALVCGLILPAAAQQVDTTQTTPPKMAMMARVQKEGKIHLRWAPTRATAWRKANRYGYSLERKTIMRDGNVLPQYETKHLGLFLPKPLTEWMDKVPTNNNAAICAQALYGAHFNVEGVDQLTAIVNLSQEQEQRFTWALHAADQDFEVALMAGLAYIDNTVKPNEKYLYKITTRVPDTELQIKEGSVFTGMQDYQELPKPLHMVAIFLDQKVLLSWDYTTYRSHYNRYFMERSEDGKNYTRLSDLPSTTLNNGDKAPVKQMIYFDSIPNDKTYFYRVRGITPFGETGPSSKEVSGMARKHLQHTPNMTTKKMLDSRRVVLAWTFPDEGNNEVSGFTLNRSNTVGGRYETVVKDIPPTVRTVQYDSLHTTNYFTVTAVAKAGKNATSLPLFVQPIDSIPPAPPTGLYGKVNGRGIVTIGWKANTEKDMLGYRLFRGNLQEEEYTQITVSPHQDTTYRDSISVNNLNDKIYYRLVAVDRHFNMSDFSDILVLEKPDYRPPTPPMFTAYDVAEDTVTLTWARSASDDVVRYELYRGGEDTTTWQRIDTLAVTPEAHPPINHWEEVGLATGKHHRYTIIATDDSGLKSEPATTLTVFVPRTTARAGVQNIDSYKDPNGRFLEVFWKPYNVPDAVEFMIYKGRNDEPVTLLKHVLPDTQRIVDQQIKPNTTYTYIVRAVFADGSLSQIAMLTVQ